MDNIKQYVGLNEVAEYLGVATSTAHQWLYRHGPESESETPVPQPMVAVLQGYSKTGAQKVVYGWAPTQLEDFRRWYAERRGWSGREAAHHWVEVDYGRNNRIENTLSGRGE